MKKLLFLALFMALIPEAGFSQFLKILHKESNTEFTGASYLFFFNAPDGEQSWSGKIKNISGSTANVRVLRSRISRLNGSTDYYCWNVCLDSTVSLSSGSITLTDNQTDSTSFHAMYRCGGASGTTIINYKFFDQASASDTASVTIHYISTPSSLSENNVSPSLISTIGPVPANESLQIAYNLGSPVNSGFIEIMDLGGRQLNKISISGNSLTFIPVQDLDAGIYLVRLITSDGQTDTRKILIQ